MKKSALLFLLSAALWSPALVANGDSIPEQLIGTWSGAWTPEGGIRDAMTIELKRDDNGKLIGRFVTPISMEFSKAAFNSKTRMLTLEAIDAKSGKQYTLNGKVEGTEIKGSVAAADQVGKASLIKWTYIPPVKW
jgi:hypothetical protein